VANLNLRVIAFFVCLLSGLTAQAVPVTFDFTGTGYVCTFASNADCASRYDGAFTGSVTIDVLADGPGGADSYTNGSSLAYDYNGWAQADFLIQWGSESFNPGPVSSQVSSDNYVQLANDYGHADYLAIRESYVGFDGSTDFYSNALFTRQTGDLTWLSDLSIPEGLGFAPGPGAFNQINFNNSTRTTSEFSEVYAGYSGLVDISSFTVRSTSVPEPGTLALLGLGLAGVGLCRRRRAMALGAVPR
jgi:hypothetical protein